MYDSLHRHRQKQDGEATQWRRISGGVLKRFQYLVSKLPLPMTEMITTMLRDIMIVWSTPVMMDGMASGLSTSFSGCPRDAQNATAASLMLAGTPRIPERGQADDRRHPEDDWAKDAGRVAGPEGAVA